jgi:hypothetical protein
VKLAASPGLSNHEGARGVDVRNWSSIIGSMAQNGWAHTYGARDKMHFDHLSSPDLRSKDILAFQRLWNRAHPNDRIAENGRATRGVCDATCQRLARSPGSGFADVRFCDNDRAPDIDDDEGMPLMVTEEPTGPGSCESQQLGRSVGDGVCEQISESDWRHCVGGSWQPGKSDCSDEIDWCHSETLGRDLPPRACVQASSDGKWYQCTSAGWMRGATSSSGAAGSCSESHAL